MIWSIILLPIVLLRIDDTLRIIIGLPFILFIPGYILVFALFPTKKSVDIIERIALSFGLSIAIVPLIGLGLNYKSFIRTGFKPSVKSYCTNTNYKDKNGE